MRVVMINDCAFIGETLLKTLPYWVKGTQVRRTRGLWGKTFGIAWRIILARGNIYHIHYLLQDCYLATVLGKRPIIGHGHGSDLRETMQHPIWGRIVRHNLRKCDKILVSTPDLQRSAGKLAKDVEYLPNIVDSEFFYPRKLHSNEEKSKVLIGSSADWRKGTDLAIKALARLKDEVEVSIIGFGPNLGEMMGLAASLDLKLKMLPKVSHQNMNYYYWNADLVLDQFKCGALGVTALEAISCGRPVITYVSSDYEEYKDFPLKDVNTVEKIIKAIKRTNDLAKLWRSEYSYFKNNHELDSIRARILEIYGELLGGTIH